MKITIVVALWALMCPAASAQDKPDVMGRSMLEDSTFKLRVERFVMHDLPNFDIKDWPQRPEVDVAIVNQIDAVREAVPDWHGLHHLVPGTGAPKN